MAKGRNSKGRRNDDWSSDEGPNVVGKRGGKGDAPGMVPSKGAQAQAQAPPVGGTEGLSRKQKKLQKQQHQQQQQQQQQKKRTADDDDSNEDDHNPILALISGGKQKQFKNIKGSDSDNNDDHNDDNGDDDDDDDDDDDEEYYLKSIAQNKRGPIGRNKKKKHILITKPTASSTPSAAGKASKQEQDTDNDSDAGNVPQPTKKKNNNNNKSNSSIMSKGHLAKASIKTQPRDNDHSDDDNDDDDDDDDDDNHNHSKTKSQKSTRKAPIQTSIKEKNIRHVSFTDDKEDYDLEDEYLDEQEDDDDENEPVEQISFVIIDDDDNYKDKKKKKSKDKDKDKSKKKEKKEKKKASKEHASAETKEHHGQSEDPKSKVDDEEIIQVTDKIAGVAVSEESVPDLLEPASEPVGVPSAPMESEPVSDLAAVSAPPAVTAAAAKKTNRKSIVNLNLKLEESIRKQQEADLETQRRAHEAARLAAEKEKQEAEEYERMEQEADAIRKKMEQEEQEELEQFYGHGDEAWNDKSAAQRAAEIAALSGPDMSLTHGSDGKKLSNKERKKLMKDREAAIRMAEYEKVAAKASQEGAQFACSQTAVNEKDPQWENSLDINIPNFSISAAGKILFKDAVLSISRGRRYGLVGPNGKGKSTLLKMIASGDLKIPPRIDFLYVEQEVVADDTPAVEAVLKADAKRWALLKEEESLMKAIDAGDEDMGKIERLQVVLEELVNMGAASAEAKARRILFGLGFDMDMQVKPTKMFSGGWRMRISLARALFVEPTLLMLDEPTNHLDLNAVIWLDDYLQRWKKTLLVVSHDQDFLNSVTEEILHIEDLKLVSYKGNYDSFKKAEKIKFEQTVKAWEKQEKRLRELKRSGQSKAKAQDSVMKNAKREPGGRNSKKMNDAIASGSQTATQGQLISRPKEYQVSFHFTDVADIGRPVMEVNQVHFRYSPKHPVIFDKVDFGIDMDSRICVVGPNGAGKSTLLKLMTGELEPTRGEVKRNSRLRMGVYNQHFVDKLPMNKTPVEFLRDRFQDEDYQSIRNRLGKYGLEGHAHEVVMRDLSGGQKARVTFVELSLQEPHILLLDEPTNNLDIESIDALIDAINEFNGGIIVVTHDQRLVENCECTLWVVEKQKVTPWIKGFDDYKETLLAEMEEQIEKESRVRQQKLEESAKAKAEKVALLARKMKHSIH